MTALANATPAAPALGRVGLVRPVSHTLGGRAFLLAAVWYLVGCAGPGHVQYDGGRCYRDGRSLTVQEVEADQAQVARRIASRQPWFAVITIGIVLLAAIGNAEKGLLLIRARRVEGHRPLAERLREVLERQRETPFRFAAIVGGSLALLVFAGGAYIYLDIDKRASERALAMLQFCHLALRTQEEESVLNEQRHNLEAIESTAGDIRTLVGELPPDEQRKAQSIVGQLNTALAKQGRIVGEYVARTDEAQKDLNTHTRHGEGDRVRRGRHRGAPVAARGVEGPGDRGPRDGRDDGVVRGALCRLARAHRGPRRQAGRAGRAASLYPGCGGWPVEDDGTRRLCSGGAVAAASARIRRAGRREAVMRSLARRRTLFGRDGARLACSPTDSSWTLMTVDAHIGLAP